MITTILQARMSSSRLPGKVMKKILGRSMLSHCISRARRSKLSQNLIIATSYHAEDNVIQDFCSIRGFPCYRGKLNDVLDRIFNAAMLRLSSHIVRITGDCPLIDPGVIDQTINFHLKGKYDYTSNALEPTFPDGLDVEVIQFSALGRAWEDATKASEREHVTPFIYNHPELFRIGNFKQKPDLSHLRWTVDEPVDLEMVRKIYKGLYPSNPNFRMKDVLAFLKKNPQIQKINAGIKRNEGFIKDPGYETAHNPF